MEIDWSIFSHSYPGSPRGGDVGLVLPQEDGALIAMVDAAGHGLAAYGVAQRARHLIMENAEAMPDQILLLLNEVCKQTVGAAASIIRIKNTKLIFSGVGNIYTRFGERILLPKTGLIGERMRTPDLLTVPFKKHMWLIMHTDGVSTLPAKIPAGSAETIARKIVEEYGSSHDDATALAFRQL